MTLSLLSLKEYIIRLTIHTKVCISFHILIFDYVSISTVEPALNFIELPVPELIEAPIPSAF